MVIYLVALVMMPCNDACEKLQQQVPLVFNQAQDHHQQKEDICSPLCGCSCCSMHLIFQTPIPVQHSFNLPKENFIEQVSLAASELYNAIWQPPRLA
jgi:hypothetical protein